MLTDHLEKLGHFCGVARAGSIRQYSISNSLSQPAISKAIQILETSLETTLFVREQQGVSLTQSGRDLLRWAEPMLAQASELEKRIRDKSGVRLRADLKMGTYQSIAVYFVPKFFNFIQREQEYLKLQFITASSQDLSSLLKTGKVDFIISIDPPNSSEIYSATLFRDTYSLYQHATSSHSPGNVRIFTLPSAKDSKGKSINSYVKSAGFAERIISCGDFEAAKAMLEADAGFSILPEQVARPLVEAKRAVKVISVPSLTNFGTHSVVFSCKAHRATDSAIKWIYDQLQLMLQTSLMVSSRK
jgi:DNA-binding transcriptional LysR family regulator